MQIINDLSGVTHNIFYCFSFKNRNFYLHLGYEWVPAATIITFLLARLKNPKSCAKFTSGSALNDESHH